MAMEQATTAVLPATLEDARIAAKSDPEALAKGGYVLGKFTGKEGYAYFATANPGGDLSDVLGTQAGTAQIEVVERATFANGDWQLLDTGTTHGDDSRKITPIRPMTSGP